MFEASFDDENTGQSAFGTEFYNEPLDNYDWDTDRSFVPQVISPSSLSSFHNASEGNKKIRLERSILIMILVQESSLIKHHFGISLRVLRYSSLSTTKRYSKSTTVNQSKSLSFAGGGSSTPEPVI
jgi:hypothetical protein